MIKPDLATAENHDVVTAATAGDESAFTSLTRSYRRELHVHCYRMLANFEDAEDLVQETFLRAWQKRGNFEGRSSFRAWLYRIATNACLDFLEKNRRQVPESELRTETGLALPPDLPWLQPYPDRLLDQVAPPEADPVLRLVTRETIELAYLVALQFLPPKQRATLILCDVLDWSATETASLLGTSVPAVNSALRRARATLRERRPDSSNRKTSDPKAQQGERVLLQQYVDATERCDADALVRLLRDDAMFSMPPQSDVFAGNQAVVQAWVDGGFGAPPFDDFKCLITYANKMPCVVNYVRRPGESVYRPFAVDVLRIEDGAITEITAFDLKPLLEAFALPETIQ